MPKILPVPSALRRGPFTRDLALLEGVTGRRLEGRVFRRLFPCVYVARDHPMSHDDWVRAALLAMPDDARVSHLTRLQRLGLEHGPLFPLHLTVTGDLHRAVDGVFLHRTKAMPPVDGENVSVEAAFMGYASSARTIDLIKVGDWLAHRGHLDPERVAWLADQTPWRPGAAEALSVLRNLDARSASLPESETRAVVVHAGLPVPEVNSDVYDDHVLVARVDLLFARWRLIIEYEGRQHLTDIGQWNRDIGRYETLRDLGYSYIQVTHEMLRQPRALALRIHRKLVELGYEGAAPQFGARWSRLFGKPCADRRRIG